MDEVGAWLRDRVIDFVGELEDCYQETTFAQDRPIFAKDIAVAAGWIVELRRGEEPEVVIEKILSTQTDKQFGDYWCNGEWGERSVNALQELRAVIRGRL